MPPPPPPLPASLPPLPEEEEEEQEEQEQQPAVAGQVPRVAPRTPTPPPAQPKTAVPPLPTLRRSGPSDWDAGELRRRYRELEANCAALEAGAQQKDKAIETWARKANAEAAARERVQVLAAGLAERGQRLEEEYGEMAAVLGRLQQRARTLRAKEQRVEAALERQAQQDRESVAALGNARRLLAASDARIHELEGWRLEGERQALQLQMKVFQLELALETAKQQAGQEKRQEKEVAVGRKATAAEVPPPEAPPLADRLPPTVPATKANEPPAVAASKPENGDAGLAQILEANCRQQEELVRC